MQNSTSGAPAKKGTTMREFGRNLLWFLAVVLFCVLGFFAGRYMGRSESSKEIAEVRQDSDKRVKEVQDRLAKLEARDLIFSSRGALFAAMDELDRRNFGLASNLVKSAGESLSKVDPTLAGVDAGQWAEVRDDVNVLQVSVSSNLETQRTRLRDLANRVDALLPKVAPADTHVPVDAPVSVDNPPSGEGAAPTETPAPGGPGTPEPSSPQAPPAPE